METRSVPADREAVLQVLAAHRRELTERFGVSRLSLFGSVARGDARPDSDVDVLVAFRETPGLTGYMALKFHLEGLLGRPVDLVMDGAIKARASAGRCGSHPCRMTGCSTVTT